MELYAKDTYQVQNKIEFRKDTLRSLSLLYQPLIGIQAMSLYMRLVLEYIDNSNVESHSHLCTELNLSIEDIERSRIKLEQYALIQTFYHAEKKQYLYVLKEPLSCKSFLSHYIFGIQLKKIIGLYAFEQLKTRLVEPLISYAGFTEISERIHISDIQSIQEKDIQEFLNQKQDTMKQALPSSFNYAKFEKNLTELAFPKKLRTFETMQLIGQLSSIYGIGEERMRVLASRSVDLEKQTFDKDKLIQRARKENVVLSNSQIVGYNLPPVLFLQDKQYGVQITQSDKKMLESLVNDYHLSVDVINVLIEYVLDNNNHVLHSEYVFKIASTWVRNKVKTKEDAFEIIKITSRNKKEKDMREAKLQEAKPVKVQQISLEEDKEVDQKLEELLKGLVK